MLPELICFVLFIAHLYGTWRVLCWRMRVQKAITISIDEGRGGGLFQTIQSGIYLFFLILIGPGLYLAAQSFKPEWSLLILMQHLAACMAIVGIIAFKICCGVAVWRHGTVIGKRLGKP